MVTVEVSWGIDFFASEEIHSEDGLQMAGCLGVTLGGRVHTHCLGHCSGLPRHRTLYISRVLLGG